MQYPRRYTLIMAAAAVPLTLLSFFTLDTGAWPEFLIYSLVYAVLCSRTFTLPSGLLITAASPFAMAAAVIFQPMQMFGFIALGMIFVAIRGRRPWPLALSNLVGVGGGLAAGSLLYHSAVNLVALPGAGVVAHLLPFLAAMFVREVVNMALIAPVGAHRFGTTTYAVFRDSIAQLGWGHMALNATGLGFADLLAREGPAATVYIVLVLLGIHSAIELYIKRAEMQVAAEHDGLTMALNRHSFERIVNGPAWQGVVAVIDCDDLKRVNDTLGHQAGDHLLRTLAEALMAAAGPKNVYRYGGDEFVVLLPDAALLAAVHKALHSFRILRGSTASIGVCTVPDEAADLPGAIAVADQRMYRAKQARRAALEAQAPSYATY